MDTELWEKAIAPGRKEKISWRGRLRLSSSEASSQGQKRLAKVLGEP